MGEAQIGVGATWSIVPDEIESRWLMNGAPLGAGDASYTPEPAHDQLDLIFEQRTRKTADAWSTWIASDALTLTHVAPKAARTLSDQAFTRGTGVQTYDPSIDFVGQALSFSLAGLRAGVSIDAATGVVSIDTDTTGSLATSPSPSKRRTPASRPRAASRSM